MEWYVAGFFTALALGVIGYFVYRNNKDDFEEAYHDISEDFNKVIEFAENLDDRLKEAAIDELKEMRQRAYRVLSSASQLSMQTLHRARRVVKRTTEELEARLED